MVSWLLYRVSLVEGSLIVYQPKHDYHTQYLTISVLQACSTLTTGYGIPSDFVRKSTASLQIKISTAQLNFSYRNVIII